jgi:hypothetical protein
MNKEGLRSHRCLYSELDFVWLDRGHISAIIIFLRLTGFPYQCSNTKIGGPFGSNLSMWNCDLGVIEKRQKVTGDNDLRHIYGLSENTPT